MGYLDALKPKDFNRSYGGVFAPEGYWENADGDLIEITKMEPEYKSNTIKHIFTALPPKDDTGLIVFSGRNDNLVAKKLIEFGCQVNLIGNEYFLESID